MVREATGWVASLVVCVRRRPTLPQPLGCSTIGAGRLNFRVRDGSGCFPVAMAAVTLCDLLPATHVCVGGVCGLSFACGRGRSLCVWLVVGFGFCCVVTSPRPISTGRLGIAAVHLRPINPMFCGGPYPIAGWETLS